MLEGQFITFLIAITLLTISPGVDTLLVMRNTARGGLKDGLVTSLGICSGLFVHAAVSAVGISVILLQSAWAFSALKFAGALYLIWLGIQSIRNLKALPMDAVCGVGMRATHWTRSIREGILSNVLNPKTIVFYMAFLPQFISPTQSPLIQSLYMAGVHFVIGIVWLSILTVVVCRIKRFGSSARIEKWVQGVTGGVMIILGIRLATDK